MKVILEDHYDYYGKDGEGDRLNFDRPDTYIMSLGISDKPMDCCYLDFAQLDYTGIENETFTPSKDMIEIGDYGIRLKGDSGYYYFIPAYSVADSWYATGTLHFIFVVDGKTIINNEVGVE